MHKTIKIKAQAKNTGPVHARASPRGVLKLLEDGEDDE